MVIRYVCIDILVCVYKSNVYQVQVHRYWYNAKILIQRIYINLLLLDEVALKRAGIGNSPIGRYTHTYYI